MATPSAPKIYQEWAPKILRSQRSKCTITTGSRHLGISLWPKSLKNPKSRNKTSQKLKVVLEDAYSECVYYWPRMKFLCLRMINLLITSFSAHLTITRNPNPKSYLMRNHCLFARYCSIVASLFFGSAIVHN